MLLFEVSCNATFEFWIMCLHDTQCTYDVTSRCIRASIVTVEKAMIIPYSECVSVVLSIQRANTQAQYYIVICGLSGCNIFFHIISCGRTDGQTEGRTDRQTCLTKLIVAFRNFANFSGRTQCVEGLAKANRHSGGYFLLCGGLLILAEDKGRIPDSITPHTHTQSFLQSHFVCACRISQRSAALCEWDCTHIVLLAVLFINDIYRRHHHHHHHHYCYDY